MIYLKLSGQRTGVTRLAILESANLAEIAKGHPAVAPDGEVVIAWTPDPAWTGHAIKHAKADPLVIGRIIDAGRTRPQQPIRPHFEAEEHLLAGMAGHVPDYTAAVEAFMAELPTLASPEEFKGYVQLRFVPAVEAARAAAAGGK